MFSTPNKKNCTYNHSKVTSSQSTAQRIVYLLPSYQPSCFFICFYHSRHEEGSAASCFRFALNHIDPLTLRLISCFPKNQTLCLNVAGCHKLFFFFFFLFSFFSFPLALFLVVEGRFWAITDGCVGVFLSAFVWVWMLHWPVCKCYFPIWTIFLWWLVHSPEVWMLFCYSLDPQWNSRISRQYFLYGWESS